jgi:integrase/recombinase XerD
LSGKPTDFGRPFDNKKTYLKRTFYLSKENQMAQAKTLTTEELEKVLSYVSTRKYAERNRGLVAMSFYAGLRVAEIASLKMADVVNADGTIKAEIRLAAEQTKGKHPRTVFVSTKLREILAEYLATRHVRNRDVAFFHTDNRLSFTANGLCVWFHTLYRNIGIAGGSSHSGRKFFITSLANKGIGVRILASLAGHRSIAVTQRYIDVNDEQKRNAVELI